MQFSPFLYFWDKGGLAIDNYLEMNPERSSKPPTASLIQENADINRIEAHQKHKEQKDKECFVNDYKIGDHAMLKRTTGKKSSESIG